MEQLLSPWRSQYIQSFKEEQKGSIGENDTQYSSFLEAAFCNPQEDEQRLVVARREHCFVIMNRYPYNNGHIMVVPNRCVASMEGLEEDELFNLMKTIQEGTTVLTKIYRPHGINFGANIGAAAGAGVPNHIHFHLVPRWNGDTNFMPVLADVKVVSESLADSWQKLTAEFQALQGGKNI
jgi:ATP adenylyltransferase